ncbi:FAD binding domain-containing protein [Cellulomonas biazotea]|uniref:FAD binding domain-containing protein n=1 Tax=Cellulomonas biazotea TaxID=1709 RepID=UPI001FE5690A|nr:FAD binding domain-containing protein [Cellulomonas biazotea]
MGYTPDTQVLFPQAMDLVDVRDVRVARTRPQTVPLPGEVVLGGGTWLFSEPQPGVHGLVDVTTAGWEPWTRTPDGLRVAATCTLAELAAIPAQPGWSAQSLFGTAVDALLGSWKIHRVATVGGNLCLALPAGPMIALAAALDGTALVWTPDGGERRVPVLDLVTGVRRTTLRAGEVLRAVDLPEHALTARVASRRASLSALGRSAAFVLARRDADGTFVLTVTASTDRPRQVRLPGVPTDVPTDVPTAADVVDAVDAIGDWYDDPHGDPRWRRATTLRFARELRDELAGGAA